MIFLSYLWHSKYELDGIKTAEFKRNNIFKKFTSNYYKISRFFSKISGNKSSFSENRDDEHKNLKKNFDKINLGAIIISMHQNQKRNLIKYLFFFFK